MTVLCTCDKIARKRRNVSLHNLPSKHFFHSALNICLTIQDIHRKNRELRTCTATAQAFSKNRTIFKLIAKRGYVTDHWRVDTQRSY